MELLKSDCGEKYPLGTSFVKAIVEQEGKDMETYWKLTEKDQEPYIVKSYDLIGNCLWTLTL